MAPVRLLWFALITVTACSGNDNSTPVDAGDNAGADAAPDASQPTCGNGQLDTGEQCDPALSATAECGTGYEPGQVGCNTQCKWAYDQCIPLTPCGNGMLDPSEACDDGNKNSNDGCSSSCTVEQDCSCSGMPSVCSCATTQLITTTTQSIDTGSLALDGSGAPHAIYFYANNYTDPVTNYSMEHAHAMYASRPTTAWSTSEFATWDQTQTLMDPSDFSLAYDGGALRAYFHRIYNTNLTFGVATKTGTSWQLDYGNQYYNYDVVRQGGNWHALSAGSGNWDLRYYMGAPGNWTRNEALTGIANGYAMRLGVASNGDAYITNVAPASGHTAYNMKLSKRLNGTTWAPVYDVQTTGTCVYPISHEPLALANGEIIAWEEGFNPTQRWLKAHRYVGGTWTVETVADLSWLSGWTCSAGGASWTNLRMVSAVDQVGQPHILYASQPANNSAAFEDHYRDATGWHVRTFAFAKGTPLDMVIDAQGTTHILALQPSTTPSTTRIVYIRISQSKW